MEYAVKDDWNGIIEIVSTIEEAEKLFKSIKESKMGEGVELDESFVSLVEIADDEVETEKVIKKVVAVYDEELTKEIGSPEENGYEWDYWAKWQEVTAQSVTDMYQLHYAIQKGEKEVYTGLRVKAIVKNDFRQIINEINQEEAYFSEYVERFPFLDKFAKTKRTDMIPTGTSAYMPTGWLTEEYPNEKATDGFERSIDMNTGLWTFQCCLKNYDNEIDVFLTEVLTNIIESAEHIERKSEEENKSIFYKYINGEISRID